MGTRRYAPLALALLLLAGLIPILPPATATGGTFTETFDSCLQGGTPPCDSTLVFGTSGTGNSAINQTNCLEGRCYRHNDTSGASDFVSQFQYHTTPGITLCDDPDRVLSFAFYLPFNGGPQSDSFEISADEGAPEFGITVSSDLVVRGRVSSSFGTTAGVLFTAVQNKWYNVTISDIVCATGSRVGVTYEIPEAGVSDARVNAPLGVDGPGGTRTFTIRQPGGTVIYDVLIDNLFFIDNAPPTIPGGAGLNVNGDIVGFDVDDSGNTILIREADVEGGGFNNVTTISAVSMVNISNPLDTDCNRADGIIAEANHVAFVTCNSGDPTHLSFRNSTGLGSPNFGSCTTCAADATLTGFSPAGGDGALQYGQIDDFPISHGNQASVCGIFGCGTDAFVAWAWSGGDCQGGYPCAGNQPGVVGVNAYTVRDESGDDNRASSQTNYGDVNQGADHICTTPTGTTNQYRLIAVDEGSSSNRYLVTFAITAGDLTSTFIDQGGYPGLNAARAVSCSWLGASKVLIGLERGSGTDEVHLINTTNGVSYWTGLTGLDMPKRGVAISGDGNWFAVVDGSNVLVGNATTGNITGQATMPGIGTFVGIEMDPFGQTMWVATTKNITRYPITAFTTIVPCCSLDLPPPGTGGGGGQVLDPNVFGNSLGVSAFGASLIIAGLIFVGIGGLIIAFAPPVGASVVFLGGFLFVWGFGWIPTAAVFAVLLLAVVGGGAFFFLSRS